ncbi:DUF2871 domain-containing protein [Amycolatopsis jejuensis]|uniref:DUF2871 domain-containing protein n=1 Tax=Amycolatopsis jejuensis TaxID=330084 RepID=UPI0005261E91|nr:DUF2871 domain-containing protein [Amycolatopsis jejuensis]
MKKIYWAAAIYTILGLLGGLYYRELTKAYDFTGDTQLSVVHTHLLALGTLFFLILLALEKTFTLSAAKSFSWFFWLYQAGLVITVGTLVVHGTLTVAGKQSGAAIAGIAGLGHILLTAAFVLLFVGLYGRISGKKTETSAP